MSLYAFGSNGNGQLSLGHVEDTHIPTKCRGLDQLQSPPKKIAAGGNHTLVLCSDGRVFAAGDNSYGQCGLPKKLGHQFLEFYQVPGIWKDISAGWAFSVFVSEQNEILVCGNGPKGELGLGQDNLEVNDGMKRVKALDVKEVVSVSSTMAHMVIVLSNGEVWGWGAARKGQLGEPRTNAVLTPRRIDIGFKASKVATGREFTIVVGESGTKHLVLGGEKYGILSAAPAQGELEGYGMIAASWGGVYVLYRDGSLRAWGRNDKGQLPPPGLKGVRRIAVGSEHAVAVVDYGGETTGEPKLGLVAWGWGEHGNCGKSREEGGGDVVGEIFEVPLNVDKAVTAEGLGAGCATSLVWIDEIS